MDPVWLLLLLPAAAASGWYMAIKDRDSQQVQSKEIPDVFFKGLNFLLNEQPDRALSVFLKATELDSNTVEMHIALGNLFRRRGEIERATSIHQNLIARPDLDDSLRALALFELAQDYFKAGLYDRSESLFQELRQIDEFASQACTFLLQIYEQEKEWHSAIVIAESLNNGNDQNMVGRLSQYCCELAEEAVSEGKLGQAEYYLESAFKYDPDCLRAIIMAGQVYADRGNHLVAIQTWRSLEQKAPDALGEVVEQLAASYKAIDDIPGFRHFLKSALETYPEARIIAALVETTRQRKGRAAGQRLMMEIIRKYPTFDSIVHVLRNRNAPELIKGEFVELELIADMVSETVGRDRSYSCRQCGFNSNTLHWQCPGCKDWGSVKKRSLDRERESGAQTRLPI